MGQNCQASLVFPVDIFYLFPEKVAAVVLSKLHLNRTVFARKCIPQRIDKKTAAAFFDRYHLMGSAKAALNYGLFDHDQLVCAASFSAGRKMDRLRSHERSYELIRFCSRLGITVTGGLGKLLNMFVEEKQPGDVMTYVDKQFSNGVAFLRLGFKKIGESGPRQFLVDKKTYARIIPEATGTAADATKYFLIENTGNDKLVFVP
jgi:hypothetical protein